MARRLIRSGVVADDRIRVVVEARKPRIVAPGLLHELELSLDARIDAEEVNASHVAVVGKLHQAPPAFLLRKVGEDRRVEQGRSEGSCATEQTMGLRHAE